MRFCSAQKPDRGSHLGERDAQHAAEQRLRLREHFRCNATPADAVDEGARWVDRGGLTSFERRRERCRNIELDRVDPDVRRDRAHGRSNAAGQTAAAPRDEHCLDARFVLQHLEPDRCIPRHDGQVGKRMDEEAGHAGIAMIQHRLPPIIERHLDHFAAEAPDCAAILLSGADSGTIT